MRYEDSDLNIRLHKAGYEIWWFPAARIFHLLPASRLNFRTLAGIAFVEGRQLPSSACTEPRKHFRDTPTGLAG